MSYSFLTKPLPLPKRRVSLTCASPTLFLCLLMAPPFLVQFLDCMQGPAVRCMRWLSSCDGYRCYDHDVDGDYDVDLRDWSYIISEVNCD